MGGTPARVFSVHSPPLRRCPSIFAGLKVSITLATIGAIVGELVAGQAGLGYLAQFSAGQLKTNYTFACIVILSLMGVALFYTMVWLEATIIRWRPSPPNEKSCFALVGLAALLLSPASTLRAADTPLTKVSIQLNSVPAAAYAPLYVAKTDGLFAKEGLDVEIIPGQDVAGRDQCGRRRWRRDDGYHPDLHRHSGCGPRCEDWIAVGSFQGRNSYGVVGALDRGTQMPLRDLGGKKVLITGAVLRDTTARPDQEGGRASRRPPATCSFQTRPVCWGSTSINKRMRSRPCCRLPKDDRRRSARLQLYRLQRLRRSRTGQRLCRSSGNVTDAEGNDPQSHAGDLCSAADHQPRLRPHDPRIADIHSRINAGRATSRLR